MRRAVAITTVCPCALTFQYKKKMTMERKKDMVMKTMVVMLNNKMKNGDPIIWCKDVKKKRKEEKRKEKQVLSRSLLLARPTLKHRHEPGEGIRWCVRWGDSWSSHR
jgi:hypothetical protein